MDKQDPRLFHYAIGEADEKERQEVEAALAENPELQEVLDEYQSFASELQNELKADDTAISLDQKQAEKIEKALTESEQKSSASSKKILYISMGIAAAACFAFIGTFAEPMMSEKNEMAKSADTANSYQLESGTSKHEPPMGPPGNVYAPQTSMPLPKKTVTRDYTSKDKEVAEFADDPIVSPDASASEVVGVTEEMEKAITVEAVRREAAAFDGNSYASFIENKFILAEKAPYGTFSIDVDTASYSNVRQQINMGRRPIPNSVRIEEMVNYFKYDYPQPTGDHPFSVNVEVASCPWNMENRLVRIGLQGKDIDIDKRPNSNLVFLLDVSGSMGAYNKLGYVKKAMKNMVTKVLTENDRVSIVVYAGAAGLVLPSTTANNKETINNAIDKLNSGGSTAGGAGIKLAYKVAVDNFIEGGINRVILCTDGDFNVGVSSTTELEKLIVEQAQSGVYLTVLGFGHGNYRDNRMETLSNKGNGNYAFIDNLNEAEKVLVQQASGTLLTIAKDVKIQVKFDPDSVGAYRLIGYENRALNKEDFADDKKDAGEIGAGHQVTALYEIVPKGKTDKLKDNQLNSQPQELTEADKDEQVDGMVKVKLRYKKPDGHTSIPFSVHASDSGKTYDQASADFKFAAAVAGFAQILRDSNYKGQINLNTILELASEAKGNDPEGYRSEFIGLVKKVKATNK